MQSDRNEAKLEATERFPLQAAPVMRTLVNSGVSGDAGVQACDYNDPVYFFLNWPAAV